MPHNRLGRQLFLKISIAVEILEFGLPKGVMKRIERQALNKRFLLFCNIFKNAFAYARSWFQM